MIHLEEGESLASGYENDIFKLMTDQTGTLFGVNDALSNVNSAWGAWTVECFIRLGVTRFVVSPGSRSTPLAMAIARHPLADAQVILDERTAAFFALGLARSKEEPVVLVCTSGSAGAHYYPAVIEASESFVSLIILTADRPDELQGCHAGQTIDQKQLYGKFTRSFSQAPVPEVEACVLKNWRRKLVHAVGNSVTPKRGAVQVNCPFRDPLPPVAKQIDPKVASFDWGEYLPNEIEVNEREGIEVPSVDFMDYGWIIAGPSQPKDGEAYAKTLIEFAKVLNWPIIADALNPVRHYINEDEGVVVCSGYDSWLRSAKISTLLHPRQIIQIGELPTSKVLRLCLSRWQCAGWVLSEEAEDFNAVKLPVEAIHAPIVPLIQSWMKGRTIKGEEPDPRVAHVARMERGARRLIETSLRDAETLVEPAVGATVFRSMRGGRVLYIGSSMPVRDAEYFWGANEEGARVYFNRGVNGIDGTLSTALGVALGTGNPTVLYVGDLTLLHDTNGWLIAKALADRVSVTVVVVNNNGGGIFNHLPVSVGNREFETYFGTPQKVEFKYLAKAYSVRYERIKTIGELEMRLAELPERGIRLFEVKTKRKTDAIWRKSLFAKIAQELESGSN